MKTWMEMGKGMAVSYEDEEGESGKLKNTVDKVLSTSHVEPCSESL